MASEEYSGTYYVRYEADQRLSDLIRPFADPIGCVMGEVTVDTAAMTVTAMGQSFPPGMTPPRSYTSTYSEGQAVVIPFEAREFGLIEVIVECDGSATASLEAGPFRGNCFGNLDPSSGGMLTCEALGPGGPLGEVMVTITLTPPDAADCMSPMVMPPTPPDCSTIPLSTAVGGACVSECTIPNGGACAEGQCRALCLDGFPGCALHCQRDESCLPLVENGNRVMIDVGGTMYEAGGCALESGPKQAYESCGSERCDGFNCLAFANANTVGLCAPECFGNDSDCPAAPPGFTAVCALSDATRRQFCAISCDPTRPTETCPPDHSCLPAGARPETEPVCLPIR